MDPNKKRKREKLLNLLLNADNHLWDKLECLLTSAMENDHARDTDDEIAKKIEQKIKPKKKKKENKIQRYRQQQQHES